MPSAPMSKRDYRYIDMISAICIASRGGRAARPLPDDGVRVAGAGAPRLAVRVGAEQHPKPPARDRAAAALGRHGAAATSTVRHRGVTLA